MVFNREYYLKKLINRKKNGFIKIVTGLRRSGKSFLLFDLFKKHLLENGYDEKHIVCINFDGEEFKEYRHSRDAYNLIKSKINDKEEFCILLDEVQYVDDFVPVLNSILHMYNVDCYVTGSNSKFLSKDVVTEFRGRGDEVHLYPLSFSELLPLYENERQCFKDYMFYGGLPFVYLQKEENDKRNYLKNIFKETYYIDILERYNPRREEELDNLLDILSSQVGSFNSMKKIINSFKSEYNTEISLNTLKKYIEMFKDVFLINEANQYDIKGRKYIGAERKYYFEDIGLRNARIGFRQNEESHIMENIIYNELLRRGFDVDVGIIKKRDKNNNYKLDKKYEVDFVVEQGHRKYYIQSALEMSTEEKREQEYQSLRLINDSFKKFVIRYDNNTTYINDYGIINLGLFDFLLKEDCFSFD